MDVVNIHPKSFIKRNKKTMDIKPIIEYPIQAKVVSSEVLKLKNRIVKGRNDKKNIMHKAIHEILFHGASNCEDDINLHPINPKSKPKINNATIKNKYIFINLFVTKLLKSIFV